MGHSAKNGISVSNLFSQDSENETGIVKEAEDVEDHKKIMQNNQNPKELKEIDVA